MNKARALSNQKYLGFIFCSCISQEHSHTHTLTQIRHTPRNDGLPYHQPIDPSRLLVYRRDFHNWPPVADEFACLKNSCRSKRGSFYRRKDRLGYGISSANLASAQRQVYIRRDRRSFHCFGCFRLGIPHVCKVRLDALQNRWDRSLWAHFSDVVLLPSEVLIPCRRGRNL